MAGGIENWFNSLGSEPGMLNGILNAVGMRNDRQAAPSAQAMQSVGEGLSPEERQRREQMARSAGYPSYEALILKQRQMGQGNRQEAPGMTMEQGMDNAMAWHPKNMFEKITEAYRGATGQ